MGAPIERFKDAYKNWRYNPFTSADMAIDKEEDNLFIPGSSPFLIQLLEQPRKNDPTSVLVYCHDDLANFVEVATAPAQGQFRVDYPPDDGKGTGLIEFNNLDAGKEVRVNYKATGSPALAEFLDTKITWPAGTPADHQIAAIKTGAFEWRYNPVCYFHERDVIYHASGEDESCLLFRFKKSANQATVILDLKGAKMHQAVYTELPSHLHAFGTLATGNESVHTHAKGTLAADAVGNHNHNQGTLAGTQPDHFHGLAGSTQNTSLAHTHSSGTYGTDTEPVHQHDPGGGAGISGEAGAHSHSVTGDSGPWSIANLHDHAVTFNSSDGGNDAVTILGDVGNSGGHGHTISGSTAAGSAHNHSMSGDTATASTTPKTYPDQLKVYLNNVNKTAEILALTGLSQFGDGLSTHGFVTVGSGEMDISSLITSAGIWEIKITEPISGAGGRCCLHAEIY